MSEHHNAFGPPAFVVLNETAPDERLVTEERERVR
jgi:hypothetical protein